MLNRTVLVRALASCAVSCAGFGAVLAVGAPAEARERSEEHPPALSISLTDARDDIAAGQDTDYTLTLRNDGEYALRDITLAQTAPAELEFREAGGGGRIQDGAVTWQLSLDPGEEVTRSVTARMGESPAETWRVATTACAGLASDSAPIVCATDANLLPAGAAERPDAAAQGWAPGTTATGLVAMGVAVAALVATYLVLALRPRGARRAPRTPRA